MAEVKSIIIEYMSNLTTIQIRQKRHSRGFEIETKYHSFHWIECSVMPGGARGKHIHTCLIN